MGIKNRETLKNYFKKGGLATEKQFIDLIESSMNIIDDGISMKPDTGLKINPLGESSKLISFFKKNSQKEAEYSIDINNGNEGLSFHGEGDKTLIKLKKEGKVGINCSEPEHELDVDGTIGIKSRVGMYAKGSIPADGKWHPILSDLDGIVAFEITAIAKGKINTGHYCVSHAIALSTYGGRGSKSKIKNTTAYYGGYRDKIIYKWTGTLHSFSLLARTRRDYGEDPVSKSSYTIDYNVSSLLKI
ncbi:hypothetical protein OAP80_01615 [Flavobacteriaceae bacterium]|jgi:hypothetical protein|nr:hypothetical protein [Flavobacteriaceae bacterium]MDA7808138.1 hypothetical protein [Flavobacteriaceae bacterium]MDC0872078.1 hypothetical protein [Flavobacteriaceae bacterium]